MILKFIYRSVYHIAKGFWVKNRHPIPKRDMFVITKALKVGTNYELVMRQDVNYVSVYTIDHFVYATFLKQHSIVYYSSDYEHSNQKIMQRINRKKTRHVQLFFTKNRRYVKNPFKSSIWMPSFC